MSGPLLSNSTVSHYRIVSKIGAGGMGDVYLAQDTKLDRRVALKILPNEFASDAERMRRFVLEAKSASALNHPNIITIYEIGETEETNFIATEYIEGKTLNNCGSLSLVAALDVATQIASALQAAHRAGIVHRDIKPDNVIIRPDGLVKVLDFGIAKQSGVSIVPSGSNQPTDEEAATALKRMTGTGTIIGTASYMSPEQARGKAIDSRSDIFSFGVVLYEMLSGRKPFAGENPMDVIGSIIADQPSPLKELLPSLPAEVDRIVSKALRKNRDERHQTAGELLVDLKDLRKRLEFEAEMGRSSAPNKPVATATEIIGPQSKSQTGSHNSIAVLPFSHLSADADNEYFCDGLAEELLNALTKIENLRVAARSSSFSFKGRNVNVSEIGRALNVNTVLEGSVRRSGDRLRISVQLCNAADGYQLWSERYDREIKDIFDVQDEITLSVVDALKLTLLSDEKDEVLKRYTKNAEAYQLYLRGRFLFFKRTPEGFKKAIEYFRQAIELDAEYALAYSGLADCFTFLGFYEHMAPDEAESNLKAPAFKSLELDDTLAETHTSVAMYRSLYQWDFVEGDKEHKRAIALNPTYALAHHLDSATVILLGRNHEAIAAEGRAIELDPFTAIFNASQAWWFYLSRRNDEAIAQSLRTIEIAPSHFFAHWVLGLACGLAGNYGEAIAALQKASALTGGSQHIKADLARVFALSGQLEEALKLLAELRERAGEQYVSAVNLAKIHLGLGEIDEVYEQLDKAFAEHSVRLPWFMLDPCIDQLRGETRFQDLLRRIGLPTDESSRVSATGGSEARTEMLSPSKISEPLATDVEARNTDSGSKQTTNPQPAIGNPLSRWWLFGLLALIVLVAGFLGYRYFTTNQKQVNSIAVMPFLNESGSADIEYLSDGMTETLIKSLSNLPNLNVKPRSSVFRYKGKDTDLQTIARELNVQTILNGRVVERGDLLTLSLELVDIQKDSVIWSEQYERKLSELVTLQSEIARDVSTKLKTRLSGAEETKVTRTATSDPEAYQAYLKGRYFWNRRTPENLKKAIEQFKIATDRDPNYALAYSGLADCYAVLNEYAGTPTSETLPQAKAYAERALSLDDQLSEPHATLGAIYDYTWQWAESEKEFKRTIELNPNYPTAYHWYSILLKNLGRIDEAATTIRRAQELDPLSSVISVNVSRMYQIQNNHAGSIENSLKLIELDPNFGPAHQYLALSYLKLRRNGEAIAESEKATELTKRSGITLGDLGYVYAASGKRTEAINVIKELEEKYARKEANGQYIAMVYAGLGEKDKAFEWLEKDFQARNGKLMEIRWQIEFESLRDDPRFKDLLRRMTLPE